MPEITVVCPACGRSVRGRELRTCSFGPSIQLVCKACFLKLKKENGHDRERKPKLSSEVSYGQADLPF